jgi:hypothetical protein
MHSTITSQAGDLRISIPLKGNGYRILLFSVRLAGWLCGWTFVVSTLLFVKPSGVPDGAQPGKLLFWMILIVFFTGGGVAACIALLRLVLGRDIVRIDYRRLTLRREIFGVGSTKHYRLGDVGNFRFQPDEEQYREGRIAFDCSSETIGFGNALDEAEANQLFAAIKQHCTTMGFDLSKSTIPIELQRAPPRPVHVRDALSFFVERAAFLFTSCAFLFVGCNGLVNRGSLPSSAVTLCCFLLVIGYMMAHEGVIVPFRRRHLVCCGNPVIGRITEKRRRWRSRGRACYVIHYEFVPVGQVQHVENKIVNPIAYGRPEVGDSVTVLYDPARPYRNVVYEFCPFRAGYRQRRQ